jgi:ESS family glutamate:Na+ symporter
MFMFVAKLLKEKLGIFKSIVFPTSLLAGFLGLIFGPGVLGRLSLTIGNFKIPLGLQYNFAFYESILFFFMIIGFVSLTLTERQNKQNKTSLDCGLFIVSGYVMQGLIGLSVMYVMVGTFWPDFFTGLGLLLPLSFGQGAGLAGSIGKSWDLQTNIGYIQQFGLTLAASGLIVGGIVGVIMLNYYIRKYNLKPVKLKDLKGVQTRSIDFTTPNEINFYDNLMVQIVWLAFVLLMTFIVSYLFYNAMLPLGKVGKTISDLILGFGFIFGIFIAMGLRGILRILESRGHRANALIDDYMMRNISSFSLNVMITASIMAINVSSIKQYLPALILLILFGTIGTIIYSHYFGKYVFRNNPAHYILAIFGMLTGVAATGLALLRGVDPDLETDTSDNAVVLGSAIATPIGIPMMAVLSLPTIAYTDNSPIYEYITIIALAVYLVILVGWLVIRVKKRAKI